MPLLFAIIAGTCFAIAFQNPWLGAGITASLMCLVGGLGNAVSIVLSEKGELE